MKGQILIALLFVCSVGCATTSRYPAKNKSIDYPACTPITPQSGDVALYWQLEAGEKNDNSLEDICTIPVLSLHPTQFAVGMIDANDKAKKFQALTPKDQEKYLRKNPEPIVIGPNGEFYIIDHHHLATALNISQVESTYGIILENKSGMNEADFWNYMQDKNWIYPVDENGVKRSIEDLKKVFTVRDLKDDPNRTLAGQTRCKVEARCAEDQWLKQPIPFIEFLWAEHFRKTPSVVSALKEFGNSDFSKVTQAASLEVKRLKGQLPAEEISFLKKK